MAVIKKTPHLFKQWIAICSRITKVKNDQKGEMKTSILNILLKNMMASCELGTFYVSACFYC